MKNHLKFIIMTLLFAVAFAVASTGNDVTQYANVSQIVGTIAVGAFALGLISLAVKSDFRNRYRGVAMMAACDIGADVELSVDCDEDFESGVEATMLICNKADIASFTKASGKKMLLTDITMKTGKRFYSISGIKQSTKPSWAMVKGLINKYKHTVKFTGFSIGPEFMEEVPNFGKGTFVVLIANNQVGTDGSHKWDVYGLGTGLTGEAILRDPFNKDNGGGIDITLSTDEIALESNPPVKFFVTNAATTATAIADLLVAAS